MAGIVGVNGVSCIRSCTNSKDWALDENCSMYQISEMGYLFDPNEEFVDMNLCNPELLDRVSNYYGNNKTNILN